MIRAFSSPPFAASVFFSVALSKTTFNCLSTHPSTPWNVRPSETTTRTVVPFGAWMNFRILSFDCLGSNNSFSSFFAASFEEGSRIVVVVVVVVVSFLSRADDASAPPYVLQSVVVQEKSVHKYLR